MQKLTFAIDRLSTVVGKIAAWFVFASILISATNAIMRFFFDMASNAALEAQWQLFSITFLYCAPWTLLLNEHIRIDVFSSHFPLHTKNLIEILGHLLILIPFCLFMIYSTTNFALASLAVHEQSGNAGGLPYWPIKMMIPPAFVLLLLQAISEVIKRISAFRTHHEELLPPDESGIIKELGELS